ncbi:hypothetical protein [Cupriavidus alkaliphilus]|uniref:hypothetical protein n=1 Tax=Cupriavidus alkaliphilus TaxID=942866 RepID=UPI00339D80ED
MPNLRIVHDNAADRAVIVASSTAGGLVAANLQNDTLGLVHRSAGTSVTYTLTWPELETVGCVALPGCNLSPSAEIRVQVFDAAAGGELLVDTGWRYACPGAMLGAWDWSQPLSVNAASSSGLSKASIWFEAVAGRRMIIDLRDPENAAGFLEVVRLIAGGYFEPRWNASFGAAVTHADSTRNTTAESGDIWSDPGTRMTNLRFDLAWLGGPDRAGVAEIFRRAGTRRWLFVSLYPEWDDALLEQDNMVYGKLKQVPGVAHGSPTLYSTQFDIEGW